MELKTKIILGAGALGALALAFSVYKAAKEYHERDLENKRLEEERMQELKDLQEAAEEQEVEKTAEAIEATIMEHYEFIGKTKTVSDLEDELSEVGEMGVWIPDSMEDEGDEGQLRFPPNSREAMEQYKAYRLAELGQFTPQRDVMYRMFEDPFEPTLPDDSQVLDHIREARIEFFGEESHFVNQASMAEVYLHFAFLVAVDLDIVFELKVAQLLEVTGITPQTTSLERINIFQALNDHQFQNGTRVGLFGTDIREGGQLGVSYMKEYYKHCDAELARQGEYEQNQELNELYDDNWDAGEDDDY